MKTGVHPEYKETVVTCGCGETFKTRSTKDNIRVEICSKCHPFYTGKQKFVDTAGMVEKFQGKWGSAQAKEMLEKQKLSKKKAEPKPKAPPAKAKPPTQRLNELPQTPAPAPYIPGKTEENAGPSPDENTPPAAPQEHQGSL